MSPCLPVSLSPPRVPDVEWKDLVFALGGFVGGLLASLLKTVLPAYSELVKENSDLRKENQALMESLRGMEDTLRDAEESERGLDAGP